MTATATILRQRRCWSTVVCWRSNTRTQKWAIMNIYLPLLRMRTGSISRYTRVVQLDGTTNGTRGRAAIDLTGIDMTGKTLCVFNEQFNGDHKTDYAGALRGSEADGRDRRAVHPLPPGGRYYFDLSAMNIPGTVNSTLDGGTQTDGTLHYVPFTYVGTVDAYSLDSAADTDTTSTNTACSLRITM